MTDKPQPRPADRSALDAGSTSDDWTSWEPVPRGTLHELRQTLDARHQRRIATWVGSVAAVLLAVGLATWQTLQSPAVQHAMSCPECRNLLHAYASHTLDRETSVRVQDHLDRCKSCLDQYAKVQQEIGESTIPPSRLASVAQLDPPVAEPSEVSTSRATLAQPATMLPVALNR